jgi:integrase/recombinase XerD
MRLRDKAILAILLDTGIRAEEMCGLTLENLHIGGSESYIRVVGKGRKEREVGLGKQAALAVQRYLSRARPKSEAPTVFLTHARKRMILCRTIPLEYRVLLLCWARRLAGRQTTTE